ncbi:hypothetical protein EG68_07109 [Paragonimus skrjabini miyazakii]|uniref:vitamin-K-epoxide reductase (warfarin-sensitive) n=1 Tax=Paragonimus skrjabini miyazakii TaxID=59628 RepID=A0A8S9YKP6_9TREM|nr:hypothetical protein EG68_07109 [Paragonimus skrjabini miyazakii]
MKINPVMVLSSLGCLLCIYTLYVEYSVETDSNYRALCDVSEHISCSKVLTSPFAKGFGLVQSNFRLLHQRNPIYGLGFYIILMLLARTMLWHLTAGFLYAEMFTVFVVMLPLFSSRTWSKFFKIGWVQKVAEFSNYYFNFFLVLLGMVLVGELPSGCLRPGNNSAGLSNLDL